jgi:hypothetical protein
MRRFDASPSRAAPKGLSFISRAALHSENGLPYMLTFIAFAINVASDLYISPRVVTADSLTYPVWRKTFSSRL